MENEMMIIDNNGEVQLPRTPSLNYNVAVTLEELYTGTERLLHVQRNVICDDCRGTGSIQPFEERLDVCDWCDGDGWLIRFKRVTRDAEITAVQCMCELCLGAKKAIVPELRCQACRGTKVVENDLTLRCEVKPGMRNGQKIIFTNEGPHYPNKRPGHVIVFVEQQPHEIFTRVGDDLEMHMTICIGEALCGISRIVTTLDNQKLHIVYSQGSVIGDGYRKCIPGKGMSIFKKKGERGHLVIRFHVTMPDRIHSGFKGKIEECLPAREQIEIPLDAEERNMYTKTAAELLEKYEREMKKNDDADEEMHYVDAQGQRFYFDNIQQMQYNFNYFNDT